MRTIAFFIILGIGTFGCQSGPTAAEKAKMESVRSDEIAKIRADSIVAQNNAPAPAAEVAKDINLNTNAPKDKKMIKTAEVRFKVSHVLKATETIEDLTAHFGGYVTYSNLKNQEQNIGRSVISRDSILISKQIVVENEIILKVPNDKLDSMIRDMNKLVVFMDYRTIKLDDVTYKYAANQKRTSTLQKYQQRQTKHIDTKGTKLKEAANAEETLLNSQLEADDLNIKNQELEDQLKYCSLTIYIYQKPVIIRETIADFDYESSFKPNIFKRLLNSIVQGWWILEEIIIFLVRIWGILLLIFGAIVGYKMAMKKFSK
jgi:hypothetical protein